MRPPNYIKDQNRFSLAGPPPWFRAQLWQFDPSLVIVPSRQGFYYRLAQRRKLNLPEMMTNAALWAESDTKMLAEHSLVPVTTILATVNLSNPYLFVELTNRAPWRLGGAEKVNAMLDAHDQKVELDKRAKTDEHLTYLSKDAWKMYRKKIGLGRSWNITPEAVKAPVGPRVPVTRDLVGFSRADLL